MVPVDTSKFQIGVPTDEDPEVEQPLLDDMREEALDYIQTRGWSTPVESILLAFGVGPIVGLFLVRFSTGVWFGEWQGDREMWVMVGDLPPMHFSTDARTRAEAFETYFDLAEDWIEAVTAGRDTSHCIPIAAAPTKKHAEMLKERVEFIRREFMPLVQDDEGAS